MRRGLGHYVSKGYGGAGQAAQRMGGTSVPPAPSMAPFHRQPPVRLPRLAVRSIRRCLLDGQPMKSWTPWSRPSVPLTAPKTLKRGAGPFAMLFPNCSTVSERQPAGPLRGPTVLRHRALCCARCLRPVRPRSRQNHTGQRAQFYRRHVPSQGGEELYPRNRFAAYPFA